MTKLPLTEINLVTTVIELMIRAGFAAWRNNVGASPFTDKYGKKRWIRFGKKGHSDIFGIQPGGRFCAVECKLPHERKRVTPEQQEFIAEVNALGGIAGVVCSPEEAAQLLGIKGLF
jgi:hypothetical protein